MAFIHINVVNHCLFGELFIHICYQYDYEFICLGSGCSLYMIFMLVNWLRYFTTTYIELSVKLLLTPQNSDTLTETTFMLKVFL